MPDINMPDISMPNLGFGEEEKPNPTLPVSVIFAFDSSVTESTLEVNACGLPYTIQSGELIPQAFMQVGHERFQSVTAYAGTGKAVQASQAADVTVQIQLVTQSVQSATSMADEENAIAFVDLQLQAAYLDANGNELARQPLNYNEQVSIWTPALTGQSVSCTTGRYDDLIVSAAVQLAGHMASIVPELLNRPVPQQRTAQAVTPRQPQAAARQPQPLEPVRPTLKFRTMLKDENNNLMLDAGEVISLHVEITNTGHTLLEGVAIDLKGTPAVVKAFTTITPIPISVGACQPGETKTIEIRGKMPVTVPTQNGELTVSVNPGDGSVIGSHRILATLQSGSGHSTPRAVVGKMPVPELKKSEPAGKKTDYLAVLVGMDRYRDTWPGAYRTRRGQVAALTQTLQTTGLFTDHTIRILEGPRATRTAIEETLLTWSRRRLGQDGVLIFYFSGQALNHPETGDVYLVPFEGSPNATAARLLSLRSLQRILATLDNRLTLLILDAPVTPLRVGGTGFDNAVPTQWVTGFSPSDHEGNHVIQIRKIRRRETGDRADVLAGLFGRADADDNGTITVGEFLNDVSAMAEITPMLPATAPEASIPLSQ